MGSGKVCEPGLELGSPEAHRLCAVHEAIGSNQAVWFEASFESRGAFLCECECAMSYLAVKLGVFRLHANVIQPFNQTFVPLDVEAVIFLTHFITFWVLWTSAWWNNNGLHVYIPLHTPHHTDLLTPCSSPERYKSSRTSLISESPSCLRPQLPEGCAEPVQIACWIIGPPLHGLQAVRLCLI